MAGSHNQGLKYVIAAGAAMNRGHGEEDRERFLTCQGNPLAGSFIIGEIMMSICDSFGKMISIIHRGSYGKPLSDKIHLRSASRFSLILFTVFSLVILLPAALYADYKKLITIDHTQVSYDGPFQLYLVIENDNDIGARLQDTVSGNDIFFVDNDGSPIAFEKIGFQYTSFHTWKWQGWVRIPNISLSQDTTFYVCYGGLDVTDRSNGGDTFPLSDGFVGVYHLADSLSDASAQRQNAVQVGSGISQSSSPFGGSYLLENGSYLNFGQGTVKDLFDPDADFTITVWALPKQYYNEGMWFLCKPYTSHTGPYYQFFAYINSHLSKIA